MKPNLTPPLNCQYGAPMGRASHLGDWGTEERFYLRRIRLDSGGYDAGGAYWGARLRGESLYGFSNRDGSITGYIDAKSRDHAKQQILEDYPDVTFFA